MKAGVHSYVSPASHGSKLVSADYHGAEVEVVRSRCAGRVGAKGIVVRDTKFTFVIVTEEDEMKSEFRILEWKMWYRNYADSVRLYSYTEGAYCLSVYGAGAGAVRGRGGPADSV